MSSADFTFITLRNITAYQPTGSWVPQNYVLTMSTNGAATWSNNITFNTLTGSTINGNIIYGNIVKGSTIIGSTIVGSTIVGSTIIGSNIGATTVGASTIYGGDLVAMSSIVVTPLFFSTVCDYTYTGSNAISSMLIGIGDNVWKIPVEFVGASS